MSRYVVLDRVPGAPTTDAVIVRDGFSVVGVLVPPLWLAWHGLWVSAAVALGAELALGFAGAPFAAASIVIGLIVGLEGPSLRMAKARRRGLTDIAAIDADTKTDAELIYFGRGTMPAEAAARAPSTAPAAARPAPTPGAGTGRWRPARTLLDNPGGVR